MFRSSPEPLKGNLCFKERLNKNIHQRLYELILKAINSYLALLEGSLASISSV